MRIRDDDGLLCLAGAVVKRAAADVHSRARTRQAQVEREAALRWFHRRDGLFRIICDVLGRDPAQLRRALRIPPLELEVMAHGDCR